MPVVASLEDGGINTGLRVQVWAVSALPGPCPSRFSSLNLQETGQKLGWGEPTGMRMGGLGSSAPRARGTPRAVIWILQPKGRNHPRDWCG